MRSFIVLRVVGIKRTDEPVQAWLLRPRQHEILLEMADYYLSAFFVKARTRSPLMPGLATLFAGSLRALLLFIVIALIHVAVRVRFRSGRPVAVGTKRK